MPKENTVVSLVFVAPEGDLHALSFPDIVMLAAYVQELQLSRQDYAVIEGELLLSPLHANPDATARDQTYQSYDDVGSQIREALPEDLTLFVDRS
jgi:hypothetical protein